MPVAWTELRLISAGPKSLATRNAVNGLNSHEFYWFLKGAYLRRLKACGCRPRKQDALSVLLFGLGYLIRALGIVGEVIIMERLSGSDSPVLLSRVSES
jgi:hypothetical protein